MSYLGIGVSPGNVPVHHGSNLKVIDKRVRIIELILRCLILGLAIIGAVLIGTDSQVKVIFSIKKEAKFTDMKVLVFLVIANGLAAAYSLIQVLRCIFSMIRGSVLFNKPLAWVIFSGDQDDSSMFYDRAILIAKPPNQQYVRLLNLGRLKMDDLVLPHIFHLTISPETASLPHKVAAAAQSGVISKFGQPELQWMKVCNLYGKFCNQIGEGIASSVIVSLSMIALSGISAFSLFRLYGNNGGKSNAR
ncbi:hypothetical protein KY285_025613 [Solanum tuberosum]|nr:hypothetical protein KY285_025613 [Solanum tuberosum]